MPLILLALPLAAVSPVAAQSAPVPVMDLHSDILNRTLNVGADMGDEAPWMQVTPDKMRQGNVRDQVLSVWVDSRGVRGPAATRRALQMIDAFGLQAERNADHIALARTVAESDAIHASGRIAMWLWLEGGAPIDDDLSLLRTFHRLGVCGMTLTWSNNLLWAGSSSDREDDDMGLTDFGREVVREMNRLRMIVDVSHVSQRTFYEVLELSTAPVVASHSGCRALHDHDRNLTDDQLRALAAKGGVVGIAAFPTILKAVPRDVVHDVEASIQPQLDALAARYDGNTGDMNYRHERRLLMQEAMPAEHRVTLDDFLDHVDHAIRIAGPKHVAMGSDFDGVSTLPMGLESAADWPNVVAGLRARGHDEQTIRDVMFENVRRVFREVLD
ncbi:MAG: dipeptidase [Candidatus Sumerlaeia bacterium]|nr:dipeptidase [Candidatus Sumerlaeia bacterium]